ncbi:MAG: hypothetical protein SPI44_02520 [Bacilli bacterium]|nr:hypothetical protein [Bacilli bacterium]
MEEISNKLEVTIEDGTTVTVNVLDFVDSLEFGKTYIIYTVNDQSDTVFASILNETEDSYSLDTITDSKELDFINNEIDRVVSELSEEGE